MITRRRWVIIGSVGLSLLGAGALAGGATERIRFDRESAVVRERDEAATARWRAHLAELDTRAAAHSDGVWSGELRKADQALARGEAAAAKRAVDEAYTLAFTARRWDGLIQVGDAYRRLGAVMGVPRRHASDARRAYRAALMLAQRFGSIDGTLRAAEAFDRLGDREVAEHALRLAERLVATAPGDPAAERVRGFAARLRGGLTAAEEASAPF